MIIGVDGNEANIQMRVGVNEYLFRLLHEFAQTAHSEQEFVVFLKNEPLSEMPAPSEYFRYIVIGPSRLWLHLGLTRYLALHPNVCDVFFAPAHYSPLICPVPLVVTIHDLAYEMFPDDFLKKDRYKLSDWTKRSVKKARAVIAVSENTKKDITQIYHTNEQKIRVVYNGFTPPKKEASTTVVTDVLKKVGVETNGYIVALGTLQPRKNITFLIDAYQQLRKQDAQFAASHKLVIIGKQGWKYKKILSSKYTKDKTIIFTGYVSDLEKNILLRQAHSFVFPSLYEGFGIPLLEAMANRCPVLCSNTSSMSEIGVDACLYFDPTSQQSFLKQFNALKNKKVRSKLIRKGANRTHDFSWSKCSKETLQVISKVVKK